MNNQKNTRGRAILFSAIFLLLTPNAYASTALSLPVFPSLAPLPNLNQFEPDSIQLTDLSIEETPSIASVKTNRNQDERFYSKRFGFLVRHPISW